MRRPTAALLLFAFAWILAPPLAGLSKHAACALCRPESCRCDHSPQRSQGPVFHRCDPMQRPLTPPPSLDPAVRPPAPRLLAAPPVAVAALATPARPFELHTTPPDPPPRTATA